MDVLESAALTALRDALVASARDVFVVLPGVGWLDIKHYAAYAGRNPRTGEPVSVPAKRLPCFTADPGLDRALAGLASSGLSADDDRDDPKRVTRTPGAATIADGFHPGLLLVSRRSSVPVP